MKRNDRLVSFVEEALMKEPSKPDVLISRQIVWSLLFALEEQQRILDARATAIKEYVNE